MNLSMNNKILLCIPLTFPTLINKIIPIPKTSHLPKRLHPALTDWYQKRNERVQEYLCVKLHHT